MAIRTFHKVDRVRDRSAGVGVIFMDIQIGALVIGQGDRAGLAREQFHMMLRIIRDVIRHRGQFTHGVDARFQIGDQDLARGTGGAIQIVRAVLDFGDSEGHPSQPGAITAQLDELEGGLDVVGENELGVLIGLQLNDALGLVDDVAITGLFSYHIRPGREHGQVDFSVLVGPELLGAVGALHGFDLKDRVGDHLGGVIGIHLHQPQTGFDIIKK